MGNAHLGVYKISGQDQDTQLPEPPSSDESVVTQRTQCCTGMTKSRSTCLNNFKSKGRYNGRERCRFINGSRMGVVTDLPFNFECGSLSSTARNYLRQPHRHYHLSSYECETLCNNNDENSLFEAYSEAGKLNQDDDNKAQPQCIDENNPYLLQPKPQNVQQGLKYPLDSPNTIPNRNFLIGPAPDDRVRESVPTSKTRNNIPDRKQYYPALSDEQFPINGLGKATPNFNNEKEILPLPNTPDAEHTSNIPDNQTENSQNLNSMANPKLMEYPESIKDLPRGKRDESFPNSTNASNSGHSPDKNRISLNNAPAMNRLQNGSSNRIPNENSYILNDVGARKNEGININSTFKIVNDFFPNDNQTKKVSSTGRPVNDRQTYENPSTEGSGIPKIDNINDGLRENLIPYPDQQPPKNMRNNFSGENQNVPSTIKENQNVPSAIKENQNISQDQEDRDKQPNLKSQSTKIAENSYNPDNKRKNLNNVPYKNIEEPFISVNLSNSNLVNDVENFPHANLTPNMEKEKVPNPNLYPNSEQGSSPKVNALNSEQGNSPMATANHASEIEEKFRPNAQKLQKGKVPTNGSPFNEKQNITHPNNKQPVKESLKIPTKANNGPPKNDLEISDPNNPHEKILNNKSVKKRLNVLNPNNDSPSGERQGIDKNIPEAPIESFIPNQRPSKSVKSSPNKISSVENQNVPTKIQENLNSPNAILNRISLSEPLPNARKIVPISKTMNNSPDRYQDYPTLTDLPRPINHHSQNSINILDKAIPFSAPNNEKEILPLPNTLDAEHTSNIPDNLTEKAQNLSMANPRPVKYPESIKDFPRGKRDESFPNSTNASNSGHSPENYSIPLNNAPEMNRLQNGRSNPIPNENSYILNDVAARENNSNIKIPKTAKDFFPNDNQPKRVSSTGQPISDTQHIASNINSGQPLRENIILTSTNNGTPENKLKISNSNNYHDNVSNEKPVKKSANVSNPNTDPSNKGAGIPKVRNISDNPRESLIPIPDQRPLKNMRNNFSGENQNVPSAVKENQNFPLTIKENQNFPSTIKENENISQNQHDRDRQPNLKSFKSQPTKDAQNSYNPERKNASYKNREEPFSSLNPANSNQVNYGENFPYANLTPNMEQEKVPNQNVSPKDEQRRTPNLNALNSEQGNNPRLTVSHASEIEEKFRLNAQKSQKEKVPINGSPFNEKQNITNPNNKQPMKELNIPNPNNPQENTSSKKSAKKMPNVSNQNNEKPSRIGQGIDKNIIDDPRESFFPNQRPSKSVKSIPNKTSSGEHQKVPTKIHENPNSQNAIPNSISLTEPFQDKRENAATSKTIKNSPNFKKDNPTLRDLPFPLKPQPVNSNKQQPSTNNRPDNRTENVMNLNRMVNPKLEKYPKTDDLPVEKRDESFRNSPNASNSEHSPEKYRIPLNNVPEMNRLQNFRNVPKNGSSNSISNDNNYILNDVAAKENNRSSKIPKTANDFFPNDNQPKKVTSTSQPVDDTQSILSYPNNKKSMGEIVSRNIIDGTSTNEVTISKLNNSEENFSNDQPIKKRPNVPNPNNDRSKEGSGIPKIENITDDGPRESLIYNQRQPENMQNIPNIISSGENQNVPTKTKENPKISDNRPNRDKQPSVSTSSDNQPPKDEREDFSKVPSKNNEEPFNEESLNATNDVEHIPDVRLSPSLEKGKVPNQNVSPNDEQRSTPKGIAPNSEQGNSPIATANLSAEIEEKFRPNAQKSQKGKVPTNDSPFNDKQNITNPNNKQPVKERLNIPTNTNNGTPKNELKIPNPNKLQENTSNHQPEKEMPNVSNQNNEKPSRIEQGIDKNIIDDPREIFTPNQRPPKSVKGMPNKIPSEENQKVSTAIKENPKISHIQPDRQPSTFTKQTTNNAAKDKLENKSLPNDQKLSPKRKIPTNGSPLNDSQKIPTPNSKEEPLRKKLNVQTNFNNETPAIKLNSLNPNNLLKHKENTSDSQSAKGKINGSRPAYDQPSKGKQSQKDNSNISNNKIHKIEPPNNMEGISNPNRISGRELSKNAPIKDAFHKPTKPNVSHNQPDAQTISNRSPKNVSNFGSRSNKNYLNPRNTPIHFNNQYPRNKNNRLPDERINSNNQPVLVINPNPDQTSTRDKLNKVPNVPIKHKNNKPQKDGQYISKPQNMPISNFANQLSSDKLNVSTNSKNQTFEENRNIQNSNNNNIGNNTPLHFRRNIFSAPNNNAHTPASAGERLHNKPLHKNQNVSNHSSNNDVSKNQTKDHLSSSSTKSLPSKVNIPNRKCTYHPYSRRQCSPEILTPRVRKASSSKRSIRQVDTPSANLNNNHSNTTIFVGINNNFMLPFSSANGIMGQCNFDDLRSRSRSEYHQGNVRFVERALLGDRPCTPRFSVADRPSDLIDINEYYCSPSYVCSPSTSSSSDGEKDLCCFEEDPCYYQLYNLQQETTPTTLPILGLDSDDEESRKKHSITTIMEDTNNNTNVSLQVLETVENLSSSSDEDEILRCLRQLDKLSAKTQALLAESSPDLITETGNQQQHDLHDTFTQSTLEADDLSDVESPAISSADLSRPLLASVLKKSSSKIRIVHFNIPNNSKP